jgi:hypothetical protein
MICLPVKQPGGKAKASHTYDQAFEPFDEF